MAVKKVKARGPSKAEPQIRDYWRLYRRRAIATTVGTEVLVVLIIALALIFGGVNVSESSFWIIMGATALTAILMNLLLATHLLDPLRDLSMAVTSLAGEKPTHALANPNSPRYSIDGFQKLLQFVYDHGATANQPAVTSSSLDSSVIETALNQTNAGVVVMNAEGVISYANRAAPIVTDEQGSKRLELLFEAENNLDNWLAQCRDKAVRDQRTWLRVPNRIVGDEDRRIFNISANYEQGSAAEVVLVAYDESALYQPEDDGLDFISFAAHELRGPITVIRGYLDVLDMELEHQLEPDQKELFKRLIVSANRLSGYINNILNTSKYDRRHLRVHLGEESLANVYDTIRDDMELRAQSQRRLLSVSIPSTLPTVAVDRSSISEVLSNLIDNALKYSNDGGAVNVSATVEGNFVKVSIADNGIGMPPNVIGNLFHKFYRSHRSRETVAGTGIGLYICKGIVESHGGKISVTSTENVGSTFSFTVPIYASVAEKLQANDHTNAGLISSTDGWIKNHSKYTG